MLLDSRPEVPAADARLAEDRNQTQLTRSQTATQRFAAPEERAPRNSRKPSACEGS